MPVVLVLCFVTAVALTLYALVFLRALLVNDWIWSSSRPSSNLPEISDWEVLPKNGATAGRDEAPCAS
ncbi:MAG TPA: hypothetical protein VFO87_05255 [Nitrospira sp.]|nr:hypothetical protein [Nitrospira sp.]